MEEKKDQNIGVVATTEQHQALQLVKGTAVIEELASTIPDVMNAIFEVVKYTPDLERFKEAKPFWDKVVDQMTSVLVQSQKSYHTLGKFLMSNKMISENVESFEKNFEMSKAKTEDRVKLYFPKIEDCGEIVKTFPDLLSKLWLANFDKVEENFRGFLQSVSGEVLIATEVRKRKLQGEIEDHITSIENLNMDKTFEDLAKSVAEKEGLHQSLVLKNKGLAESSELLRTRRDQKTRELEDLEKNLHDRSKDSQKLMAELSEKVEREITELESKKRRELDACKSAHDNRVQAISDSKQRALNKLQEGNKVETTRDGWWIFSWTTTTVTRTVDTQKMNEAIQGCENARSSELKFVKQETEQIKKKYDEEIESSRKRTQELNKMRNEGIDNIINSQKKEIESQLEKATVDLKRRQDEEADTVNRLTSAAKELQTAKELFEIRRLFLDERRKEYRKKIEEAEQELRRLKTSLDDNLKKLGSPSVQHAYYLLASILDLNKTVQYNVQTLSVAGNYAGNYVRALQAVVKEVRYAVTLKVDPRESSELDNQHALLDLVKSQFPKHEHIHKLIVEGQLNIGTIYEFLNDEEILTDDLKLLGKLQQKSWVNAWEKKIPSELSEILRVGEVLKCVQTFKNVIRAETLNKISDPKETEGKFNQKMKKAIAVDKEGL
jgi:hypothetical protein